MYTSIVPCIKETVKFIFENHHDLQGNGNLSLIEHINLPIAIDLSSFNFDAEYQALSDFLRSCNLNLEDKYREEEYHYKFLEYGLLQKIRATQYFHNQGIESRKIVLFSEDCISLLQWFSRTERRENFLNVYMRSSDALGLLGTDLLYLCRIADSVMKEHPQVARFKTTMNVNIASCHIYLNKENKPVTRDGSIVSL